MTCYTLVVLVNSIVCYIIKILAQEHQPRFTFCTARELQDLWLHPHTTSHCFMRYEDGDTAIKYCALFLSIPLSIGTDLNPGQCRRTMLEFPLIDRLEAESK